MRNFLNLPIRWQMFLIVFIVALPTLGTLVSTLVSERHAARDRAINDAQKLASSIATEEQNLVAGVHQLLTVLTQLPELRSQNSQKLNPILADILRKNPLYTNINVTDRNGVVWASAVPLNQPTSQSDKRFFKNAISSGRFSSGEYTVGNITKKQSFHFALPYWDQYGEISGVIGCGIDISSFKHILDRSKLPANSNFSIVDHRGVIITRALETEKFTGKPDDPENFRIMRDKDDEGWFYNYARALDGINRYAYFIKLRLKDESEPYMYIRAGVPVGSVYSVASMPIIRSLSVLCIALFAACASAYYISKKSILERVEHLKAAANQIKFGNRAIKFSDNVKGGEFGELAESFDSMANQLVTQELDLANSKRFLNTIIETEPECIKMIDIDGNLLMMNSAGLAMIQADSFEQVKGKCVCPLITEPYRTDFMALTKKVFQGMSGTLEFETVGLKGRHVWLETHAVPFRDEHGEINALLGITRDTTERKQASEQLLRVMREQSVILDNSPIGICLIVGRKIVWANEKLAKILRYSKSELEGDTSQKLYPSQEAYKQLGKDAYPEIAQGREYVTVQELIRGDGSHMWGRYNGKAVDSSDLDKGTIWILEDITDRRLAEEQQSQFAAIITSSTDAIISKTLEGIVTSWNPAAERMFGYSQQEMLGQSMALLMPPDRTEEEVHILDSIKRGINIEHYETTRLKKNGDTFPVSVTISPIIDKSGAITGASKIVRDISERKKEEQEKHALEQQFLQAQKMESLGVLAGGIAHDFNNILAIIKGNCSLAMMDEKNCEAYIGKIDKATDRAAGLCRQMLTYAGKAQFTSSQINLWMLVDEMVNMLRTTLPQNVVIKPNIKSDIPFVNGDASQIRQIVMNLIINAAEAIGDNQGEIQVSLTKEVIKGGQIVNDYHAKAIPPGWYDCLEVTDTGCGMDDETMQRIFEPFFTTKFTGRGLGMSAVLGIIMSHNGSLQLFSRPGQGTTFKIYLPVLINDSAEESLDLTVSSEPWTGSGTILLVEDEELIREIAKDMLQMLGFTVIDALNGQEALDLYKKSAESVVCVVTDLGMPVMDGYNLFSELKKLKPNLPIVVSSGFGESVVTTRIALEAIAGLVSKPYSFDKLREVMKNVFDLKIGPA